MHFPLVLVETLVHACLYIGVSLLDPSKIYAQNLCSTQLSLLINVKMPTVVGLPTFMSRKNRILGLSEAEKS